MRVTFEIARQGPNTIPNAFTDMPGIEDGDEYALTAYRGVPVFTPFIGHANSSCKQRQKALGAMLQRSG
jgi:hypothetical protein